jgi:DNA-3-methyladenine glycosylase
MAVLPRRFYARPALEVAADLIGATLVHRGPFGTLGGVIVEVEAYGGADDPASHARGGPTRRNRSMFGAPGHAYVYFTYGMHHCLNVVTGREGEGAAVLLRAVAPTIGREIWRRRRPDLPPGREAAGPGRLARALGLTLAHDGLDLLASPLTLRPRRGEEPSLSTGPRIGIRRAREYPWRIWWTGHPAVSRSG